MREVSAPVQVESSPTESYAVHPEALANAKLPADHALSQKQAAHCKGYLADLADAEARRKSHCDCKWDSAHAIYYLPSANDIFNALADVREAYLLAGRPKPPKKIIHGAEELAIELLTNPRNYTSMVESVSTFYAQQMKATLPERLKELRRALKWLVGWTEITKPATTPAPPAHAELPARFRISAAAAHDWYTQLVGPLRASKYESN